MASRSLCSRTLGDYAPEPKAGQYRARERRGILPQSQAWQFDAQEQDLILILLWIAGQLLIRLGKLEHNPHDGCCQIWDLKDAEASAFDLSQYRRVGMGDDSACAQRNSDAVVTHEPCEIASRFCNRDQARCKGAFSGPSWPANEHAGFPDHDRRCVEIGYFSAAAQSNSLKILTYRAFGRNTRSLAPSTGGTPSAPGGPRRLSADMCPS